MTYLSSIIGQTTGLFHSANINELMGDLAPREISEAIEELGLSPDDLASLAPSEVLAMLREQGVDLHDVEDTVLTRQIGDVLAR